MKIKVFLNDLELSILERKTLYSFLEENDLINEKGIAIALNDNIIRKEDWTKNILANNDRILVVIATQGG